jgi:hypothetical protein
MESTLATRVYFRNSLSVQHGESPRGDYGCSAASPRVCDAGPHVQHGDTAELRALDFDDVGDTLADHERGASLEDIDPRGYVS